MRRPLLGNHQPALYRARPIVFWTSAAACISGMLRGVLYLFGPPGATTGAAYRQINQTHVSIGWWGIVWLAFSVGILAMTCAPRLVRWSPLAMIVFAAYQLGWGTLFFSAAMYEHPSGGGAVVTYGRGMEGALVFASLAAWTWLMSWATTIAIRQAPGRVR